jgi:RNA polymerase sigma-70 factor, ECF subfamily
MESTQIDISTEFLGIKDKLTSYLYRLTANREDAEDLVHDTFLKVNEKIDSFQFRSTFKTWVFAIATNLAHDNKRVKNRWELDAQDKCKNAAATNTLYQERMINAFQSQTERQFDIAEHINYCFTCIAKNLSLEKQIAIILKEVYEFKREEIAEILKLSEGIVKHLLHDGRKELQEKYEQRCALINKTGVCYQCSQLSNYFEKNKNAETKIDKLGLSIKNTPETNLDARFELISRINPLTANGAKLEDTILQILRETIQDN